MISEVELHNKLHWLFHPIPIFAFVGAANTFIQSPCLNEYDSLRGYVFYSYLYMKDFHNASMKSFPLTLSLRLPTSRGPLSASGKLH